MRGIKRHFAALLAGAVLTAGVSGLDSDTFRRISAETISLTDFYRQLASLTAPKSANLPFQTLRYSAAEQMLYRDDVAVGSSFGDYRISDGKLMYEPETADGFCVPAEQTAALTGSIIQKNGSDLTIKTPFQKARLIVKASSAPDLHGAKETVSGYKGLFVMQYDTPEHAYQAYQAYQQDPEIQFVDPDYIYCAAGSSSDIFSASIDPEETSWGVSAIGADSYCQRLLGITGGLPDIRVAVIDTGVYTGHQWMKSRIAEGGAGFIIASDGSYEDRHGHGTHCAGIIVSATPENVGIIPIKALDDEGYGESLEVYCAMMYAAEIRADVVNMSLGGEGESPLLEEAAAALEEAGIPVCVSAGNEANELRYYHPASLQSCFVIGAVDKDLEVADFSNYGETIDFVAPGVNINSASCSSPDATTSLTGTSMSAPFASAAIADLLSAYPGLTISQISSYLRSNAIDLGEPGFDSSYGWGMISLKDFRFSDIFCPQPTASMRSGNYDSAIIVELSCTDRGAEIYYTLDGRKPDPQTASRYFVPLHIASSAEIRAVAVIDDVQSRELHEIYFIGEEDPETACTVEQGVLTSYCGQAEELRLDLLFPDGTLTAVGAGAFADNTTLRSVTLPDSVTEIADQAFVSCLNLTSLIGKGVRRIGTQAFQDCESLQIIDISGVTDIGRGAFMNCSLLNGISDLLDESVSVIPPYAFCGCSELTSLNLTEIKEIGKKAFVGCGSLSSFGEVFIWKTLRVIGDSALRDTLIGGSVSLDSLESVGKYAFSGTRIQELVLPESITVIPDGLAYLADSLYTVTAPGVSVIGEEAFCRSSLSQLAVYMNIPAITSVGSGAFRNVQFLEPLSFDSLEALENDAFSGTSGISLSFPSVLHLQKNVLQNVSVSALYFESCESVAEHAISGTCCAVFSNSVRRIAQKAFDTAFLAAHEASIIYNYAKSNRIPVYQPPSLLTSELHQTVTQGEPAILRAQPLGFGDWQVYWSEIRTGTAEAIPIGTGDTLSVNTSDPGVYQYLAELSEPAISEIVFTVTVLADSTVSAPSVLKADQTELISWETLNPDSDGQYSADYTFRSDRNGKMKLYLTNASCSVQVTGTDGLELSFNDCTEDFCFPLPVRNGADYRVRLTLSPEYVNGRQSLYSALLLSGRDDLRQLTDSTFSCDLESGGVYSFNGACVEPKLLNPEYISDQGRITLTEADYCLRYTNNTSAGTGNVIVFGTGDYWGHKKVSFSITGLLEPDKEAIAENIAPGESCMFSFIPDETGLYFFYADYPEEDVHREISSGAYDASFWECNAAIAVLSDSSFIECSDDPDSSNILPSSSLYLNGQTSYQVKLTNNGSGLIRSLCVKVVKDVNPLNMKDLDFTDDTPYVTDGQPVVPELIYSGEKVLVLDRDYTAESYFNDHAGKMLILIRGCGDYRGSSILVRDVYGVIRENKQIPLTDDLLRNGFRYRFIPKQTGRYLFYTDFTSDSLKHEIESDVYHAAFYNEPEHSLFISDSHESGMSQYNLSLEHLSNGFSLLSAELEAGRTYYIGSGEALPNGLHDSALFVRYQTKHIAKAYAETPEQYPYTGSPIAPDISLYDGDDSLTENTDYTVQTYSDTQLGKICSVVTGIGKYCGRTFITSDIIDSLQIGNTELNTPFLFTNLNGEFDFVLDREMQLELAEDDGLNIAYTAYVTSRNGDQTYDFENGTLTLTEGEYVLNLAQDQAFSRSMVLKASVCDGVSIAMCSLKAIPVTEDGTPQLPVILAFNADEPLAEGEDYFIVNDGEMVQAGVYELTVRGGGKYTGETQVRFCILSSAVEETEMLQEGDNSAVIRNAGETVFYRWMPDQEQYCFSSQCLKHKQICIIDPAEGVAAELSGIGEQYLSFQPEPERAYYVSVSFSCPEDKGTLPFCLDADCRMLSDCEVVYNEMVQRQDSRTLPDYTVCYQGELLQEDTDFIVDYIGGETRCGRAVISLSGIGRYRGSLSFDYYIFPESPEAYLNLYPDDTDETVLLEYEESASVITKHPGYSVCFRFTAPLAGKNRYRIDYPEGDFTSFLYDPEGKILPLNQTGVVLEQGQSIQILCIASWLEIDLDFGLEYRIAVMPDDSFYDEETGFTFKTEKDTAFILSFQKTEETGILMHDTVTDPETGTVYMIVGKDDAFEGDLSDVTLYSERESKIGQICRENGWCTADTFFSFRFIGDVTGEGTVDQNDVLTLLRCLAECSGMRMCSAAQQAADCNQDGLIDLRDVQILLMTINS